MGACVAFRRGQAGAAEDDYGPAGFGGNERFKLGAVLARLKRSRRMTKSKLCNTAAERAVNAAFFTRHEQHLGHIVIVIAGCGAAHAASAGIGRFHVATVRRKLGPICAVSDVHLAPGSGGLTALDRRNGTRVTTKFWAVGAVGGGALAVVKCG